MAKRTPEEVLDAIDAWDEDDAIDAAAEHVLAKTPEERDADLRGAGVDVAAEEKKAIAWREAHPELQQKPPASKVVRLPVRTRFRILLVAAAVGLVGAMLATGGLVSVSKAPPGAAELRKDAFAECDAQHWDSCLKLLDEARGQDPAGEQDPRVRDYRGRAETALHKR